MKALQREPNHGYHNELTVTKMYEVTHPSGQARS